MRGVADAQRLAAAALGLNRWQGLRYVILPQAMRIALPPLLGQYMNIVKNTSLTMAIGLAELSVLLSIGSALASALLGLVLGIALSLAHGWPHLLLGTNAHA